MPKPDLLEELKDARKRYEKHGLKMLETLSVEFFCFFPVFPGAHLKIQLPPCVSS